MLYAMNKERISSAYGIAKAPVLLEPHVCHWLKAGRLGTSKGQGGRYSYY